MHNHIHTKTKFPAKSRFFFIIFVFNSYIKLKLALVFLKVSLIFREFAEKVVTLHPEKPHKVVAYTEIRQ